MARTTETAVREVISTFLTTPQVKAFIDDANLWVTEELSVGFGITSGRLELIERYLACALVRLRDLGIKSTSVNDISENYQVDSEVTDYLKRAASFDPTGKIRQAFLTPTTAKPVKFRIGQTFVEAQNIDLDTEIDN